MILDEKKKIFKRILFQWHKDNYREMSWRNTRNPYRILISEIMLQQTQVERVSVKYAEFLKAFPTVQVLAVASLGDVLRTWSGLGYNRRAKYLHACAKEVVRAHGAKFPSDETELKKLPGIGPSTAAALSSFAFNGDAPMIDTNIRRILVRIFYKTQIPRDRELYLFAKELIPEGKGREWNYAMLDVGATLCTARGHSPLCPLTPLHGKVSDIQKKYPQQKFTGSRRYYRGQILKLLVTGERVTAPLLLRKLGIPQEDLRGILDGLIVDKLIMSRRGILKLFAA